MALRLLETRHLTNGGQLKVDGYSDRDVYFRQQGYPGYRDTAHAVRTKAVLNGGLWRPYGPGKRRPWSAVASSIADMDVCL
jgi:hypothetical protein